VENDPAAIKGRAGAPGVGARCGGWKPSSGWWSRRDAHRGVRTGKSARGADPAHFIPKCSHSRLPTGLRLEQALQAMTGA